jgi:hypothetical protein
MSLVLGVACIIALIGIEWRSQAKAARRERRRLERKRWRKWYRNSLGRRSPCRPFTRQLFK